MKFAMCATVKLREYMRALVFVSLIFAGCLAAGAVNDSIPADTVVCIEKPHNVKVIKNGTSVEVKVEGRGNDERFNYSYVMADDKSDYELKDLSYDMKIPFVNRPWKKTKCVSSDFYAGPLFVLEGGGAIKDSWQFGIGRLLGVDYTPWYKGPSFGIGFGIAYRQMSVGAGWSLDKQGDKLVTIPIDAENIDEHHGRIRSWSVQVPFVITQKIYRSLGFSLGVVMDLNFYTKAFYNYCIGDTRYSIDFKGLHQRMLTPELYAAVGSVDNIGVYVRYVPVSMFKAQYGPSFKTLSIGVTMGF